MDDDEPEVSLNIQVASCSPLPSLASTHRIAALEATASQKRIHVLLWSFFIFLDEFMVLVQVNRGSHFLSPVNSKKIEVIENDIDVEYFLSIFLQIHSTLLLCRLKWE